MRIQVEFINNQPRYLDAVKELWRLNRRTLGFFPDGAFNGYASSNQIIVAIDSNKNCIGYLLFSVSKIKVTIVHLCVDNIYRNSGVARKLVQYLKENTRQYKGIALKCRRDYGLENFWPRLNFIPLADVIGKSKDGKPLTYWWYDQGHPTLFSIIEEQKYQLKIRTVLDANIFFDLYEAEVTATNSESKSLKEEWLQDKLDLCLTEEIYVEINRQDNKKIRDISRSNVHKHTILKCKDDEFTKIMSRLRPFFWEELSSSDESDFRQLARA